MDLDKWKEKNKKARRYAHFDERVSLDRVWGYISNSDNIKKHGFYPFIYYEKKFNKYVKKENKGSINEKERKLCYCAHIDRYIYSYYGYLINQEYNRYMKVHNMDMVAVAYRDNLGKSNINFAKRAFDCIKGSGDCYIIIGDFSDFFESLNHIYLKERLCEILDVKKLPDDYYAVFKNITKYSSWKLTDLLTLNGLNDNEKDIKLLNTKPRVLSKNEFKKQKKVFVHKHQEDYGIPQGSPISAVLANVYMIKIDEKIYLLAQKYNGLYMRYSDDFIIVLPGLSVDVFKEVFDNIFLMINAVPNLTLQPKKTQVYKYKDRELNSCSSLFLENIENGKNQIDYLGFTFDGKEITIRDKTITKYYYRMYRKLKTIIKCNGYTHLGHKISCKNLYQKYTIKGAKVRDSHGNFGNFITYVQNAQKIFGEDEAIDKKTKRHMLKIRRRLDQVL